MSDDLLDRFVAFSATATAFSVVDLHGTGQGGAYLATVVEEAGPDILRELLDACEAAASGRQGSTDQGSTDQGIAGQRSVGQDRGIPLGAIFGSAKLGPLARNIVKLWYSGVWYELPPQWVARFGVPVKGVPAQRQAGRQGGQPAPARTAPFVVSPAAYTEGLLWRAVGAHPAGAKAPGYGSWAEPPAIEGYKPEPFSTVQAGRTSQHKGEAR